MRQPARSMIGTCEPSRTLARPRRIRAGHPRDREPRMPQTPRRRPGGSTHGLPVRISSPSARPSTISVLPPADLPVFTGRLGYLPSLSALAR